MGYIVRVRPAKGAKVKKDDPSDYNSVAMRPKSFARKFS